MLFNKKTALFLYVLCVLNISIFAEVYSDEQIKINVNDILSPIQLQKVTPDPNEFIDLFTGTLKLSHTEYSVPVATGLNMEFKRSYSSDIYHHESFIGTDRHDNTNLQSDSWTMHAGYISVSKYCNYNNSSCKPVYISSNLQRQILYKDQDNPQDYRTLNNWIGKKTVRGYLLISTSGIKYYFDHYIDMANSSRYYLTKIENLFGQYIQYDYRNVHLLKIFSSNDNQTIKFKYTQVKEKNSDGEKSDYANLISEVLYNDKSIVKYAYKKIKSYRRTEYILSSAKYSNGRNIFYEYDLINLRDTHHIYNNDRKKHKSHLYKSALTKVSDNNNITVYKYSPDTSLSVLPYTYNMRLTSINKSGNTNIQNGQWSIGYNSDVEFEGIKTKKIVINNGIYTTENKYIDYQSNDVWRAGKLVESIIYKNTDVNTDNIAQKINYKYKKSIFNDEINKIIVYHDGEHANKHKVAEKIDKETAQSLITEISIKRDNDYYTVQYNNYDKYNNPQIIIKSNSLQNNSAHVKKYNIVYSNNNINNILGLFSAISLNNKLVLKQDFNTDGQIIESNKLGVINKYSYLGANLYSITDGLNNSTTYSNYENVIPQEINKPDGTRISKIVNSQGLETSVTNANGHTIKYEYNLYGKLLSKVPARGSSTIYEYPSYNNIIVNHGTNSQQMHYTAYNLLYKLSANNYQTDYNYDSLGRVVSVSNKYDRTGPNPNKNWHTYSYDSLNRITAECLENQDEKYCTKYFYFNNNTVKAVYPNNEVKTTVYNSFGGTDDNIITEVTLGEQGSKNNPSGYKLVINRNDLDLITSVSQNKITKKYTYDNNYKLIKYTEPETGSAVYSYDKAGNIISKKINSTKINYIYNNKNYNLIKKEYNGSNITKDEEYRYDQLGNVVSATKGLVTRDYVYDANENLISESLFINKSKSRKKAVKLSVKYKYNDDGYLDSLVYPDGSTINFNPDQEGRATSIGAFINNISYYPSGHHKQYIASGQNIRASVDGFGRVNQHNFNNNIIVDNTYDSNNNLLQYNLTNNANQNYYELDFGYDNLGRITTANGPWGRLDYKYDSNNNIKTIANYLDNILAKNTSFDYDTGGHLVNTNTANYYFDSKDSSKQHSISTTKQDNIKSYNSLGQTTSDSDYEYVFGIDGNLYHVYGKHTEDYYYDTNNTRILKQEHYFTGKKQSVSFYTREGKLLYQQDLNSGESSKFLYLNNYRVAKIDTNKKQQEQIFYYYYDSTGSPLAIANQQGKIVWSDIYLPFGYGLLNSNAHKNNFSYTGTVQDRTGLNYFGAREYSSRARRFLSPDPMQFDPNEPFSFNKYIYGNNNPYKYYDPDGKWVQVIAFGFGFATGFYSAYSQGDGIQNSIIAGTIGGGAGVISTTGATFAVNLAVGFGAAIGNDLVYNYLSSHNDRNSVIDAEKALVSTVLGTMGGKFISKVMVPKINFPYSRATQLNYTNQTLRQFEHQANTEFFPKKERAMVEEFGAGFFGFGSDQMFDITKSFFNNRYSQNESTV